MEINFEQKKSSLNSDGSRNKIRIADVKGFFTSKRIFVFFILIGVYFVLPLIKINHHPLIFIDILHRKFYLFGQTFNSQDFYLVFFLISGIAFLLFYLTALLGRVWCGWACPQTVFLEGVFRKIERFIEGDKGEQIKLANQKWNFRKLRLFTTKHFLYFLSCLLISHIFLSYFVSLDQLKIFITGNPKDHWEAFLWMGSITTIIYINFAWFREQLCLIVCPYGRIQSALTDDDTLVIGYDENRGEPRGKKNDPSCGDCINCRRCIEVCPTGIDIRNGLQLECIGCANCIDACDEIMEKISRPKGLIRYDSLNGLFGKKRKILRPRIYLYTFLLLLGAVVASIFFFNRDPFSANLLRLQGSPYLLIDDTIRNQYLLHLFNKTSNETIFTIKPINNPKMKFILPIKEKKLGSLKDSNIPVFVEMKKEDYQSEQNIIIEITDKQTQKKIKTQIKFLGP